MNIYYVTADEKNQEIRDIMADNYAKERECAEEIKVQDQKYNELILNYNTQMNELNKQFEIVQNKIDNLHDLSQADE